MNAASDAQLVSVLLPTFNRADLIGQAIDSVLAQTHPRFELIVIDDGSTDTTAAVVSAYGDKLIYKKVENGGKAAALNVGLGLARGEFIFVLDDDDLALPTALERLVAALDANPDAGLVYSSYYRGLSDKKGHIYKRDLFVVPDVHAEDVFPRLLTSMFFTQQGSLVRSHCYREVGDFDPAMKRAQDYEMLLRLTHRFQAVRIPEPTVVIRTHEGARGPASERFAARDRMMRGWSYTTRLYEKLNESLDLVEYLPRSATIGSSASSLRREALFKRISVMLRKGVWEPALTDLQEIMQGPIANGPLSPTEITACEASFRNPPTVLSLAGNAAVRKRLDRLLSGSREVARHFARGAYWAAGEMRNDGELRLAMTIYLAVVRIQFRILLPPTLRRSGQR